MMDGLSRDPHAYKSKTKKELVHKQKREPMKKAPRTHKKKSTQVTGQAYSDIVQQLLLEELPLWENLDAEQSDLLSGLLHFYSEKDWIYFKPNQSPEVVGGCIREFVLPFVDRRRKSDNKLMMILGTEEPPSSFFRMFIQHKKSTKKKIRDSK